MTASKTDSTDVAHLALQDDLGDVQVAWRTATPVARGAALMLACERSTSTFAAWMLTQPLHELTDHKGLDQALSNAARVGHADLLIAFLALDVPLNWTEAMVQAVLRGHSACMEVLAPHTDLDAVIDDLQDNYDDSYQLSYAQMAQRLDGLAAAWTPAQRDRLDREMGLALLPQTAAVAQQQAIQHHAQRNPSPAGRRGPRRS
jgi:hypothetical protein